MKEIDIDESNEGMQLRSFTSSTEEQKYQQTIQSSQFPGQAYSHDEDLDSSSSDEFDIDIFRSAQNYSKQESQPKKSTKASSHLKVLGIEFEVAVLQERNMNTTLYLKSIIMFKILFDFLNCVTFMVGLDFSILPMFSCISLSIAIAICYIYVCKISIRNGIRVTFFFLFTASISAGSQFALFLYALLIRVPFNSLPLFILLEYILVFLTCFITALLLIPNFLSWDDPNYQLKFFVIRILVGFFNATGFMDALTDIVLGINLVQYPQKKFFIIGIFLLILCNTDYIQVIRKIVTPEKFSNKDYLFTVLVEVVVLVLTTIVLIGFSNASESAENENALFATAISISTTVVNFLHNLFLLYNKTRQDAIEFL